MTAYYNEFDPKAAAWLRELIKAGLIADGIVDERGIEDVEPDELAGFAQCHFFAGIGGWSYALRLAGWPDDRPVWTGSCPCQPFSAAGKGAGAADDRHLWPVFWWLIAQRQPAVVFGEQVASSDGRQWLAGVRADLETLGYAVGAADLCAAGVGAPHIRQRLFWVADGQTDGREQVGSIGSGSDERSPAEGWPAGSGLRRTPGGLADADQGQRRRVSDGEGRKLDGQETGRQQGNRVAQPSGSLRGVADSDSWRQRERGELDGYKTQPRQQAPRGDHSGGRCSHDDNPWSESIWLPCADGKARRIEPSIEPLAHGVSGRVGLLRGYGNAIVPQVAAKFVRAFFEG